MPCFQGHRGSGLGKELSSTFSSFSSIYLPLRVFSLFFPPAFGYGLLCLGMAYISSQMGPVLQVRTMQKRKQLLREIRR